MSAIDEVKDRLDIVEVVSSYVQLDKSGRNYKALCPFHSEKTPSFVVFPDSQRWYCFGACSEGGDVFSFVMRMEGWNFRTALQELAGQAGVELRPRTPAQAEAEEEAERLRELLATAARYYHHILVHAPEAEAARDYVARRGLNDDTVERFMLGYSLPGWERTRDYMTEQGYAVDELLRAGLVIERDSGGTYDRFRERLMIPIGDRRGRVIGFGARTLDPEGVPKYINSPKTVLFDKSETLFGLDLARRAIRREDRVVIAEGYTDVMQAHQAGHENVVAQMGTALTEPQLRQLQRYARRMILALDADAAGVQATLRGVEVAQDTLEKEWEPVFDPRGLVGYEGRLGAEIRILRLPRGQDPDDLISQDPDRWAELVEDALPVVDFYLQVLMEDLDLDDSKAKAGVVEKLLPVLRAVANPVERDDYVQKIARALRVDERAVLSRLRSSERPTGRSRRAWRDSRPRGRDAERARERKPSPGLSLESHLLSMLVRRPPALAQINAELGRRELDPLSVQDFQDTGSRVIFEAWQTLLESKPSVSVEALTAALPVDLGGRLEELLATDERALGDEQLARHAVRTVLRLRERELRRVGQELSFLTRDAQEAGDVRAEDHVEALQSYLQTCRQALFKTQRALARPWGRGGLADR